MTEMPGGDKRVVRPRSDASSAGSSDEDSRLTNAARALSLGALLSGRAEAIDGIEEDIEALGMPLTVPRATSWEERRGVLDASDVMLREVGAEAVIDNESRRRPTIGSRSQEPLIPEQRVQIWEEVSRSSNREVAAYTWLRLLMAESDPLLAASASSALSHWRRPKGAEDADLPTPLIRARETAEQLTQDTDDLASAIAQAARGVPSTRADRAVVPRTTRREPARESVSLLVHGTFAFTERWWYPGGDFHNYIKTNVRSDLYDLQDTFWWSGRYKTKDRKVAAERLAAWLEAKGDVPVDTVFAHSYGGAVALQATMHGLRAKTVVLLSTPVDTYEVEWRNVERAVSLRIHCDLVLLAARTKQRFTANVEEHWIDSWFVHHGASHDPMVWIGDDWSAVLAL